MAYEERLCRRHMGLVVTSLTELAINSPSCFVPCSFLVEKYLFSYTFYNSTHFFPYMGGGDATQGPSQPRSQMEATVKVVLEFS